MSQPVDRTQQAQQPTAPSVRAPRPVPPGLGGAATTIQPQQEKPKEEEKPKQPKEVGYVETAVVAIKNWVIWLFKTIFCCFGNQAEEQPPPPAPDANQTSEREALQNLLHELLNLSFPLNRRTREEFFDFFDRYFATEADHAFVYTEIGQAAPRSWRHMLWQSYATIGKQMVEANPKLLLPYLLREVNARIEHLD